MKDDNQVAAIDEVAPLGKEDTAKELECRCVSALPWAAGNCAICGSANVQVVCGIRCIKCIVHSCGKP